jgi:hypothetical protein
LTGRLTAATRTPTTTLPACSTVDEHRAATRAGDKLGVPVDMIELDVAELEAACVALNQPAPGSRKAAWPWHAVATLIIS